MFADKELDNTAVIFLVVEDPVQVTVIVGGSTIDHVSVPLVIDVVGGTVISNLPPAFTAVIVVENKDNVVTSLTVLTAL